MGTTKASLGRQTDLNASGLNIEAVADPTTAQQAATKAYVDARFGTVDAFIFKGLQDCSANPNYPAADAGWTYKVSVAGKIGGASGINVEVGDMLLCLVDSSASGNQATVGANWNIEQTNIDGAVTGPASAASTDFATFNGTSGKVIQDSGIAPSTDGTFASNTDTKIPTEKAIKTYIAATAVLSSTFVVRETPTGTINGSNVTFTLANTPIAGSEEVYLNGLQQEPGAGNDYTISTNTITYLTAPVSGDKIRVSYRK